MNAMMTSVKLVGSRSNTSPSASWAFANDLPKSSWMTLVRNTPYCTIRGLSRPYCLRISSSCSRSPVSPANTAAGSPVRRSRKNNSVEIANRRTNNSSRRRPNVRVRFNATGTVSSSPRDAPWTCASTSAAISVSPAAPFAISVTLALAPSSRPSTGYCYYSHALCGPRSSFTLPTRTTAESALKTFPVERKPPKSDGARSPACRASSSSRVDPPARRNRGQH